MSYQTPGSVDWAALAKEWASQKAKDPPPPPPEPNFIPHPEPDPAQNGHYSMDMEMDDAPSEYIPSSQAFISTPNFSIPPPAPHFEPPNTLLPPPPLHHPSPELSVPPPQYHTTNNSAPWPQQSTPGPSSHYVYGSGATVPFTGASPSLTNNSKFSGIPTSSPFGVNAPLIPSGSSATPKSVLKVDYSSRGMPHSSEKRVIDHSSFGQARFSATDPEIASRLQALQADLHGRALESIVANDDANSNDSTESGGSSLYDGQPAMPAYHTYDPSQYEPVAMGCGPPEKKIPAWLRESLQRIEEDKQKQAEKELLAQQHRAQLEENKKLYMIDDKDKTKKAKSRPLWKDDEDDDEEEEDEENGNIDDDDASQETPGRPGQNDNDTDANDEQQPVAGEDDDALESQSHVLEEDNVAAEVVSAEHSDAVSSDDAESEDDEATKEQKHLLKIKLWLTEILMDVTDSFIEEVSEKSVKHARKGTGKSSKKGGVSGGGGTVASKLPVASSALSMLQEFGSDDDDDDEAPLPLKSEVVDKAAVSSIELSDGSDFDDDTLAENIRHKLELWPARAAHYVAVAEGDDNPPPLPIDRKQLKIEQAKASAGTLLGEISREKTSDNGSDSTKIDPADRDSTHHHHRRHSSTKKKHSKDDKRHSPSPHSRHHSRRSRSSERHHHHKHRSRSPSSHHHHKKSTKRSHSKEKHDKTSHHDESSHTSKKHRSKSPLTDDNQHHSTKSKKKKSKKHSSKSSKKSP